MRLIYHLVSRADWEQPGDGFYRAASLASEGFIHCSNREQVARVANLFYANQSDLAILCIDAGRVQDVLRDEDIGTGECFPHVYGPIPRAAVVEVRGMERDAQGQWTF